MVDVVATLIVTPDTQGLGKGRGAPENRPQELETPPGPSVLINWLGLAINAGYEQDDQEGLSSRF